jgi:hypothetical protein
MFTACGKWHLVEVGHWSRVGKHSQQPHTRPKTNQHKVSCATCSKLLYSLELLMMGIIVPETCWENYKFNKSLCSIELDSSVYTLATMNCQPSIKFIWRRLYLRNNIWRNSFRIRMFKIKCWRKSKQTFYVHCAVYEMWKNTIEPVKSQMKV